MTRLLALGLLVVNALVMALLGENAWAGRDQGMAASTPSHGALAMSRWVGLFPFPLAVFLGVALLLAAAFVYPWPGRPAETLKTEADSPEQVAGEPGVWPPPPARTTEKGHARPQRHWARPDPDED